MRGRAVLLSLAAGAIALRAQSLTSEKYHELIVEKSQVRVYRLTLAPSQATGTHLHEHPYAYFALQNARLSHEVPGRQPKVVEIEAGEVHISKGGFRLAERNVGTETAVILIVEPLGDRPFSAPMAAYALRGGMLGPIFEQPGMRAYATRMEAAGETHPHRELHDRLLVALTDIQLVDLSPEYGSLTLNLKAGEVKWLPKGGVHILSNEGKTDCTFHTFEFP